MKQIKQAKRYATGLLRNVGIDNAPQSIAELNAVSSIMVRSKEFKSLLMNPQFTSEEREKVVKQIAERLKLSGSTVKFINYLSDLGVAVFLPEIIRIATSLYLEKKRRAKAIVTTPIEISKDHENTLRSSLKKVTDRDVDIEYVMDPSLLGGILIKIGSTMYDTSLRGQLRLLKDELIKG